MKKLTLTLAFLSGCLLGFSQKNFTTATLQQILDEYKKDSKTYFINYLSDDFRDINSQGIFQNKKEIIKANSQNILTTELFEPIIYSSGELAIVSGIHQTVLKGTDGNSITSRANVTYTFLHKNNKWMFVASQRFPASITKEVEEEAIKKTILGEFDAWLNRDLSAWSEYYVDSPQNIYMITPGRSAGQLVYRTGFENMKISSEKNFKTPVNGLFDIIKREDWKIKIFGNVAYVSYKSTFKMGDVLVPAAELKVLEKIYGKWKISATAAIGDYKNATPPIKSSY